MRKVVIVGGNRELGTALIRQYHVAGKSIRPTTFTSRHPEEKHDIVWITKVDMTKDNAGAQINRCWDEETKIDVLIICTGSFVEDTISTLNRSHAIESFNIGALGPVPLIHTLRRKELLKKGSKVVIVNEAGAEASIALKHESGERGNYGACASRAALNMVVKLLSIDLKEDEIPVAVVHTGWLRRDTHVSPWFKESRIRPEEAARYLIRWIETFDMSMTGQFWSVTGTRKIPTADAVLGVSMDPYEPCQLPW